MIDVKHNYFAIYACQVITLSSFNLHSVVCQLHLNKTGRKKRHEWLKDSGEQNTPPLSEGSPETYLLGSGLLGDFCQSDIYLLWSTLSWKGACFKQRGLYRVAEILNLFSLKIHLLWKNPERWSTSLTSGGRAVLPHVHGAALPTLIISSNLRSGGVAWLFSATWAACWFPGALEREKHRCCLRTAPVFVYW